MNEKVFIQARTTPDIRKKLAIYALRHDTSIQRIIEDYIQTLIELDISPDAALAAIREAKQPGN